MRARLREVNMDYFAGETYRPEDVKVGWTSMRVDLVGSDKYGMTLTDTRFEVNLTDEINTRYDLDWRYLSWISLTRDTNMGWPGLRRWTVMTLIDEINTRWVWLKRSKWVDQDKHQLWMILTEGINMEWLLLRGSILDGLYWIDHHLLTEKITIGWPWLRRSLSDDLDWEDHYRMTLTEKIGVGWSWLRRSQSDDLDWEDQHGDYLDWGDQHQMTWTEKISIGWTWLRRSVSDHLDWEDHHRMTLTEITIGSPRLRRSTWGLHRLRRSTPDDMDWIEQRWLTLTAEINMTWHE